MSFYLSYTNEFSLNLTSKLLILAHTANSLKNIIKNAKDWVDSSKDCHHVYMLGTIKKKSIRTYYRWTILNHLKPRPEDAEVSGQ